MSLLFVLGGRSPFVQSASLDNRISEDNKGHQMLKKMGKNIVPSKYHNFKRVFLGWGETGLGASKQGIYDPVEAAEVRTDLDKFRVKIDDLLSKRNGHERNFF